MQGVRFEDTIRVYDDYVGPIRMGYRLIEGHGLASVGIEVEDLEPVAVVHGKVVENGCGAVRASVVGRDDLIVRVAQTLQTGDCFTNDILFVVSRHYDADMGVRRRRRQLPVLPSQAEQESSHHPDRNHAHRIEKDKITESVYDLHGLS